MATIADVARLAGVSVSTVSYALTGVRPISQSTKERIEDAMVELGYTPNAVARSLKMKRSRIIALLFPVQGAQLGLSSVEYVIGASDHAQRRGYHLLLWTSDANTLDNLSQLARQGLIDGALLMEVQMRDPRLRILTDAGLPFTMIGRTDSPGDADFTDTDFDQCARLAIEYLGGFGHRRIGFVNLAEATRSGRGNAVRLRDGLVRAAAAYGMVLTTVMCERSHAAGRAAFGQLIRGDPALTAVIAFNEQAIPGVMAAATEHGLRIPLDFSVLSIDMPLQLAEMTNPPMTTIGPVAAEVARVAIDVLIRRLEGESVKRCQSLFKGLLQERGTVAVVRASADVE
ncbi:MAG TPA: LacI family DNA-binding transcriptional regulator [Mycobacterium sp.]|jgi:DNA-binding LacI/PurR family transcriptional regulator|nr:LacI family DNA-binding transcriptional regulator [Mycobacterium sp.]